MIEKKFNSIIETIIFSDQMKPVTCQYIVRPAAGSRGISRISLVQACCLVPPRISVVFFVKPVGVPSMLHVRAAVVQDRV